MHRWTRGWGRLLGAVLGTLMLGAAAQAAENAGYTDKGADTCLKCHDEDSDYPVLPIYQTPHAERSDAATPFAGLQCEACHGPGADHSRKIREGDPRPPINNFGRNSLRPAAEQNGVCLDCHQRHQGADWQGSAHQRAQLSCASCHTVHAARDPAVDKRTQPEVCTQCHQRQRGQLLQASSHPLRYGQMGCSDCHAAHGGAGEPLLVRPTTNQTCTACHAEKRGPFLWEHAPAAENCALCHDPHGANQPALLKRPAPMLCQQCHAQAGHPSINATGAGLSGAGASAFVLGRSCSNCHTQVHGSNHPSGVKMMR